MRILPVLVLLATCLYCLPAQAQHHVINGYLTQQNSGHKPIVGARVQAKGANPTTTDSRGYFMLVFVNKQPGDVAVLDIYYPAWEVVNKEALSHTVLPNAPRQDFLKLYMCPEGQWQVAAQKYYKINLAVIEQAYDDTLAVLNAMVAESWEEKEQLGARKRALLFELDAAKKRAQEISEKYAQVNLDDTGPLYRKAFNHFKKGNFEKAQHILQSGNLAKKLALVVKEERRIARVKDEIKTRWTVLNHKGRQYAEAAVLKGRLHVTKVEMSQAYEAYEWALKFDSAQVQNWYEYGALLQEQNRELDALPIFQYAINEVNSPELKFVCLIRLAGLYSANAKFNVALPIYHKVLHLYDMKYNHESFDRYLATALNNMGKTYEELRKFDSAIFYFRRALPYYRALMPKDSVVAMSALANTYHNMGTTFRKLAQYDSALNCFNKASLIYSLLVNEDPSMYSHVLGYIYNSMGIMYINFGQYDSALVAFKKYHLQYEKLVQLNPDRYLPNLAEALNNLGTLLHELRDLDSAQFYLERARTNYSRLAAENPSKYAFYLSRSHHNIANLYRDQNAYDSAFSAMKLALDLRKQLAKSFPVKYGAGLARTYNGLGLIFANSGQLDSALAYYTLAKRHFLELPPENVEALAPSIAIVTNNIGAIYIELRRYDSALITFQELKKEYSLLTKVAPKRYNPLLGLTLDHLGEVYSALDQQDSALLALKSAYQLFTRMAEVDPRSQLPNLALTLNVLGHVLLKNGAYDSASLVLQQASTYYTSLSKTHPTLYKPMLALNYHNLGKLQASLGQYPAAIRYYHRARHIQEKLVEENPRKHAGSLAEIMANLATLNLTLEGSARVDSAIWYCEQGLLRLEIHHVWQKVSCYHTIAKAYHKKLELAFDFGLRTDALEKLRKGMALLEMLPEELQEHEYAIALREIYQEIQNWQPEATGAEDP